jgi:hypothetical protein
MFRKLFVIVLSLALLGGVAVTKAGGELVLRVDTDGFANFDATAPGFNGGFAFYVNGDICKEPDLLDDCTAIGEFQCWGWDVFGDGSFAVVSQEFNLFGRGKIQVQGVEDAGPRAVTGGTGDFRNVRGEATGFDFSQFGSGPGEFIATFKLIGAKKSKKNDDD